MTQPNLAVEPDDLRRHARSVAGLVERTQTALQAAEYLAAADDGFGMYPRPLVKLLLDDNHQGAVDAIRKVTTELSGVPAKLETNAASFESADKALGTTIGKTGRPIEDVGGFPR
ncbi:type VII secretion target [Nocardia sp. NPDC059180]|uniref:type VII secretion target n=1 Tax=Nocardia sp. NPDC059180 TaxID=3346761 RepID=UPI00367D99CB